MKCDDMHMMGWIGAMVWFDLFIYKDMIAFDTLRYHQ